MSTILKALQEIEGRAAAAAAPTTAPSAPLAMPTPVERLPLSPTRARTRALLALAAAVLGGGALYWVRADHRVPARPQAARSRHAPADAAARAPQTAPAPPRAQLTRPDTVAPTQLTRSDTVPPSQRTRTDAVPPSEPAPRADILSRPDVRPAVATAPRAAAPASRRAAPDTRREAPPAAVNAPRETSSTANGSGIQVTSIVYSANVADRSAALRIDGRPVTLRQGDSVSGIEVQLIMRDAVYLRRGAEIFAVDARR